MGDPAMASRHVDRAVTTRLRAVRAVVKCLPTPRATPFTFVMVVALAAMSIALRFRVVDRDGAWSWSSTNVTNLVEHPVESLLASAFVVTGGFLPQVVAVALAFTALERAVGTKVAAVLAWAGHVVATLVTEGGLALGIRTGLFAMSSAQRIDVGVSYALFSAVGACLVLLPRQRRFAVVIPVLVLTGIPLMLDTDLTSAGHALALAFGVAALALVKRRRHLSPAPCRIRLVQSARSPSSAANALAGGWGARVPAEAQMAASE